MFLEPLEAQSRSFAETSSLSQIFIHIPDKHTSIYYLCNYLAVYQMNFNKIRSRVDVLKEHHLPHRSTSPECNK